MENLDLYKFLLMAFAGEGGVVPVYGVDITNGMDLYKFLLISLVGEGGGVVPVFDADIINGIASFSGVTKSKPLVSLKLNIPVTQEGSGTSSPDNIRDFIGFSGVNVQRTGKNLLDDSNTVIIGLNMWFYGNSSTYKFWKAGTYMFSAIFSSAGIKVYYTLQGTSSSTNIIITSTGGLRNKSFTIPQDGYYRIFAQKLGGISADDVINPMIAISDDLTYEPYTGNTYLITFGQTVCAGTLDVVTGELVATHELKTIDENSGITMLNGIVVLDNFFDIDEDSITDSVDCNFYQRAANRSNTSNVMENNPDYSFCCKNGRYATRVMIKDTRFTSIEDYKSWLSTNPVKIAVKLATPITIQLTPTQITTLIGENVIFADVGDITECKYTRK